MALSPCVAAYHVCSVLLHCASTHVEPTSAAHRDTWPTSLSEGQDAIDLVYLSTYYDIFVRKINPTRYLRALEAEETPNEHNRLLDVEADDPHTFSYRYEP